MQRRWKVRSACAILDVMTQQALGLSSVVQTKVVKVSMCLLDGDTEHVLGANQQLV